jgi:hypothetical protein
MPMRSALRQFSIGLLERRDERLRGFRGAKSVVLVRMGIAEIGEQPVAGVLGDAAFESLDDVRRAIAETSEDFSELFRLDPVAQRREIRELAGERGHLPLLTGRVALLSRRGGRRRHLEGIAARPAESELGIVLGTAARTASSQWMAALSAEPLALDVVGFAMETAYGRRPLLGFPG